MNDSRMETKPPKNCPQCGSELQEREGKYGKFLGCSNFPECKYTYDLSEDTTNIKCPDCGKYLRFRSGPYGRFLSCSGYPECKFAYNPEFSQHPDIFCSQCGEKLEIQTRENKKYLICKNTECDFEIEWIETKEDSDKRQVYPKCPKCNNDLVKRTGQYGIFLGCSNYPECRFAFNPELENQENLTCPICGKVLEIREGRFGKFVGCIGYPECRFTFDLRK
ncbi:MAG: type I DNA topoisomerase [Candidatus Thorarchaeota archaeon]